MSRKMHSMHVDAAAFIALLDHVIGTIADRREGRRPRIAGETERKAICGDWPLPFRWSKVSLFVKRELYNSGMAGDDDGMKQRGIFFLTRSRRHTIPFSFLRQIGRDRQGRVCYVKSIA